MGESQRMAISLTRLFTLFRGRRISSSSFTESSGVVEGLPPDPPPLRMWLEHFAHCRFFLACDGPWPLCGQVGDDVEISTWTY